MTITIDGLSTPQLAKTLGASVQLDSNVVGDFYQWAILDKPAGSAAALSSATAKNPTITPDISGSYFLKLAINGSLEYFALFAAPSVRTGDRFIAYGEGDPDKGGNVAGVRGWAADLNVMLRRLEGAHGKGAFELCYNGTGSAIAAKQLTYIADVVVKASGLSEEQDIPSIAIADALTEAKTRSVGVALDAIADTALGLVLRKGLLTRVDTSSFTAVGDPVYLSDTPGEFDTAAGTNSLRVGYVVKKHATEGAIYIDPGGDAAVVGSEYYIFGDLEPVNATYPQGMDTEAGEIFASYEEAP